MGPDAMILVFWMLSLKPTFSLSSFTFIKRLFSSSLLSAIMVLLSASLRLLIFLPAILIPACASSNPAFLVVYSAYKLNKQGDNIQPWRETSLLFQVQFLLLLPALRTGFSGVGQVLWYSHLLKNFPQFAVIHTGNGFGVVNKAEVDVFLELSCCFNDPATVLLLISCVPVSESWPLLGGLIKPCLTLVPPWTVACQVPLSTEFSRQEY